jgi:hypothetical protein
MKQYFIYFLMALFLSTNVYFYFKTVTLSKNKSYNKEIVLESEFGKTIIKGGKIILLNKENLIITTLGSSDKNSGELVIHNNLGYEVINLGAHYGDGMSGNGLFNINNQNGEYGWSVIGRVREEHYQ